MAPKRGREQQVPAGVDPAVARRRLSRKTPEFAVVKREQSEEPGAAGSSAGDVPKTPHGVPHSKLAKTTSRGGKLKYLGVSNLVRTARWQAQVYGKYLGTFDSEELAAEAVYFYLNPKAAEGRVKADGGGVSPFGTALGMPLPPGVQAVHEAGGVVKYTARCRKRNLGTFDTVESAAEAYQAKLASTRRVQAPEQEADRAAGRVSKADATKAKARLQLRAQLLKKVKQELPARASSSSSSAVAAAPEERGVPVSFRRPRSDPNDVGLYLTPAGTWRVFCRSAYLGCYRTKDEARESRRKYILEQDGPDGRAAPVKPERAPPVKSERARPRAASSPALAALPAPAPRAPSSSAAPAASSGGGASAAAVAAAPARPRHPGVAQHLSGRWRASTPNNDILGVFNTEDEAIEARRRYDQQLASRAAALAAAAATSGPAAPAAAPPAAAAAASAASAAPPATGHAAGA